jgi:hypothetical protein
VVVANMATNTDNVQILDECYFNYYYYYYFNINIIMVNVIIINLL